MDLTEEGSSWDMITENDLWEGESIDGAEEEYVVVSQDDIVEGIACFMAAYLLSLKQTKVCNSLASFASVTYQASSLCTSKTLLVI